MLVSDCIALYKQLNKSQNSFTHMFFISQYDKMKKTEKIFCTRKRKNLKKNPEFFDFVGYKLEFLPHTLSNSGSHGNAHSSVGTESSKKSQQQNGNPKSLILDQNFDLSKLINYCKKLQYAQPLHLP